MPVSEERAFTQCAVDLHLRKAFIIGLPRPSNDRLDNLRNRYKLAKLVFDDDRDLIGRDGRTTEGECEVLIREVGLLSSSDRAAVICLGTTTSGSIAILQKIVCSSFDLPTTALRNATGYLTYNTTTKVRFSGPVTEVLGSELKETFHNWADLKTRSVVAPFAPEEWPPESAAMVHTSQEYWERHFGGDAPARGFVVPADLDFFVYLPSRFYKMTKYRFRVRTETFEDFLEGIYYVHSELPYNAHMELLNKLDRVMSAGT